MLAVRCSFGQRPQRGRGLIAFVDEERPDGNASQQDQEGTDTDQRVAAYVQVTY